MNTHIFTWEEALNHVYSDNSIRKTDGDWCSVLTYSRKLGLGAPVTFQRTKYSDGDLNTLRKIVQWWSFLNEFSNLEFRDKITTQNILRNVLPSFIQNKDLIIFTIFCPSYKKGKGEVGYTGSLGRNTIKEIELMSMFVNKSLKMGVNVHAVAYFSDLLLENYSLLQNTDYKQDLENNFLAFQNEFRKNSTTVETYRLSEIESLKNSIGEAGFVESEIDQNSNLFKKINTRNAVFYKKELGWNEKMVSERTKILLSSYSLMGLFFKNKFPRGIMFWTESAYERGKMYNTKLKENIIPIIYPKK